MPRQRFSVDGGSVASTFTFLIGVVLLVSLFSLRFSLPFIFELGVLLGLLFWLFVVISFPWDIYLAAKQARVDADNNKKIGIEVDENDYKTLKRLEIWLFFGALSVHVVTAVIVYLLSLISDIVRPQFYLLFVISAIIRPSVEFYTHLESQIKLISRRVLFPRADCEALNDEYVKVTKEKESSTKPAHVNEEVTRHREKVSAAISEKENTEDKYYRKAQERISQLSQSFEDVIHNLSSGDRDLVIGLKALANLFKSPPSL